MSDGVEWTGRDVPRLPPAPVPADDQWPEMRSAQEIANEPCDGVHPQTGALCVLRWHRGYHHDRTGAEWLDA